LNSRRQASSYVRTDHKIAVRLCTHTTKKQKPDKITFVLKPKKRVEVVAGKKKRSEKSVRVRSEP
jgi:hypothetical protein